MSNDSKRAEGAAEEIGGKIKGGVGKLIGNDRMNAEGTARWTMGIRGKTRTRYEAPRASHCFAVAASSIWPMPSRSPNGYEAIR